MSLLICDFIWVPKEDPLDSFLLGKLAVPFSTPLQPLYTFKPTQNSTCALSSISTGAAVYSKLYSIKLVHTQFSLCVLNRGNVFSNIPKSVFIPIFIFYLFYIIIYFIFATFEIGCYGPTWLMPKSLPVANFKVFVIKWWMYKKFTHITLDKYFKLLKNAVFVLVKLQYNYVTVCWFFMYRLLQFLQSTQFFL